MKNSIVNIKSAQVNELIPYEGISNLAVKKAAIIANNIINDGWGRRGYPNLLISSPIPWKMESRELRSWNFHIHCWDMLDSLLLAHSVTLDISFLTPAIKVALDWVDKYSNNIQTASQAKTDENSFAWYDMAVGMRAYRLAYLLDAASRAGIINELEQTKLWDSLNQHRVYLENDNNIIFHNNHGFYQVVGQLAMGRRFSKASSSMAKSVTQGEARLTLMLRQQFAEDGIHREHSPDYHRMVYDTLKSIMDANLICNPEILEFCETIETALSWFVTPNRQIVNLGDSDTRDVKRSASVSKIKWRTAPMRYVVTGGEIGALPEKSVQAFTKGGYFVVRKPSSDTPHSFSKSSYLVQTAAFHSRTHKHADDLSFIWSDRGSEILVDSGRYGYIGKAEQGSSLWLDGHWYSDPNRVYCESTRAHNTLEFDNKNYLRKGALPYGSAMKRWVEDSSGITAIETECKHFGTIQRTRVLVFMPGKWLIVFDWFNDNAQQPHNIKQWFHLAPQLELHLDKSGYLTSFQSSAQPLRIISLLDKAIPSRLYLGEEKPVMQGWWSGKERDIIPNYAFCYEQSGVETGVFATLFSFSETLTSDTNWSKVNVSGRKGQFRWIDEKGTHIIRLERPVEGKFDVSYVCI